MTTLTVRSTLTLCQKTRYMRHQVAILEHIYEKYRPSEATRKCNPDDPMYDECHKYSELSLELIRLIDTYKEMIKYNEIIIEKYGNEG